MSEAPECSVPRAPLTSRELEVVELVMSGLASAEIAEELGITRNTAENHRHSILRKARVRNTAELVRLATLAQLAPTVALPSSE